MDVNDKKVYGKLSELEKLQFNEMRLKLSAIDSLFQRLIREQCELEKVKEEWFVKLRKKHSISNDDSIVIDIDNNIVQS